MKADGSGAEPQFCGVPFFGPHRRRRARARARSARPAWGAQIWAAEGIQRLGGSEPRSRLRRGSSPSPRGRRARRGCDAAAVPEVAERDVAASPSPAPPRPGRLRRRGGSQRRPEPRSGCDNPDATLPPSPAPPRPGRRGVEAGGGLVEEHAGVTRSSEPPLAAGDPRVRGVRQQEVLAAGTVAKFSTVEHSDRYSVLSGGNDSEHITKALELFVR